MLLFSITVFCFAQNPVLKNLDNKFDSFDFAERIQLLEKINVTTLTSSDKANYYYLFGKTFYQNNQADKTLSYYMQALDLYKAQKNIKKTIELNLFIAQIKSLSDYSYEEYKPDLDNAIAYAKETKDDKVLRKTYITIGIALFDKNIKEAVRYYNLAKENNVYNKDLQVEAQINSSLGLAYTEYLNNLKLARQYHAKALNYYIKTNDNFQIACSYINYAAILYKEKKIDSAIYYYKKADALDVKEYTTNFKIRLYEYMSEAYKDLKDYKNALEYDEKKKVYENNLNDAEQLKAIKEIDTKYKTKENLLEIHSLKNNLLTTLIAIGVLIIVLVLFFLGYQNLKKKKIIAEKEKLLEAEKLDNYLKNQELHEIDVLMEGQEKERIRLANELHDNLGSLMATLKLNVHQLKEKILPKNPKEEQLIHQIEGLIGDSYEQIRNIAHTQNAGVIAKDGLLVSIQNITQKISNIDGLTVEVIHFGMNERFENALEISIFRMVQEAITNILKYAKASHISIYLTRHEMNLNIIIEDNGVGFDTKNMQNKGMGLTNIEKKVEAIGGTFTIDSRIGKGTNLIIDLPV